MYRGSEIYSNESPDYRGLLAFVHGISRVKNWVNRYIKRAHPETYRLGQLTLEIAGREISMIGIFTMP